MKNIALIVIDMQKDFINGSLGSSEAQAICGKACRKIEEYKRAQGIIIYTQDTHYNDYLKTSEGKNLPIKHCIIGTEGWTIPAALDIKLAPHIKKDSFGYPFWNKIKELEESEEIEIIGLCTDICVISNALILKACFPEKRIIVDASCCAGTTPTKHYEALDIMRSCQIEVINEN